MKPLALTVLLVLAGSSCGGGGTCVGGSFCDKLSLGTGSSGFVLTGEGDSFSVATLGSSGQIWFRLESGAAFGNRAGRLYITYAQGNSPYWQRDYSGLQSVAHLLLSSFRVTDPGSFTVKAYLVEQVGPDLGKETFVAEHALTMTK